MSDDVTVNRGHVMKLRFDLAEQIALTRGRHKTELEPLEKDLALYEQYIKKTMADAGEQQFKSEDGNMAFFQNMPTISVEDVVQVMGVVLAESPPPEGFTPEGWGEILEHVQRTAHWGLLNKHIVNKEAAMEIIKANGTLPGVKSDTIRQLQWRRGK